jgi:uncharacterized membrane protein
MEVIAMVYLIAGVLLWSFLHIMPAVQMRLRSSFISRTSKGTYRAIFSLLIIGSIVLMVAGWKALPRDLVFMPFSWADEFCLVAMLGTSILFLAPYMRSNILRYLRHPQLTGIVLWGVGHVLATGQMRSLILFGGIAVWCVIEMLLINRRDGAWIKPEHINRMSDFKLLVAGIGFFMLFMFTHLGLFGVTAVPG